MTVNDEEALLAFRHFVWCYGACALRSRVSVSDGLFVVDYVITAIASVG